MRNKTLGGQIGPTEITSGRARAADVDLAGDADRHRFAVIIENVHFGIRDRPADRHGGCIVGHMPHFVPGRECRCLRRAVDVQQPARTTIAESGRDALRFGRFAAEQHVATAEDVGRDHGRAG